MRTCNNRPQAQAYVDLRLDMLSVVIITVKLYSIPTVYQQRDSQYRFTVCAFVTGVDHDLHVTLLLSHQKASVVTTVYHMNSRAKCANRLSIALTALAEKCRYSKRTQHTP